MGARTKITDEAIEELLRSPKGELFSTAERLGIPRWRVCRLGEFRQAMKVRHRLRLPRRSPSEEEKLIEAIQRGDA